MSAGVIAMAPRDTFVARLDVRVKFALLALSSTLIFAWNSIWLQAALLGAVLAAMAAARVPVATVRRLALLILPAVLIVTLIQGLFSPFGQTPVFTLPIGVAWLERVGLGGATVFTREGLVFGLVVGCRILVPLLAFQLVFMTSEPNEIVLGLVRVGLPYRVAFLVSTTFRFVPLLLGELRTIQDVQKLRGVDLASFGLVKKLTAFGRMIVPLIVSSLGRAQELEVALQARGFGGENERTHLYPGRARLNATEWVLVAGMLALFVGAVAARAFLGIGSEVF